MSQGMAYDSDNGRDYAAAITAIMTGEAYLQSAKIAGEVGPCAGFDINRESIPERDAHASRLGEGDQSREHSRPSCMTSAWNVWSDAVDLGEINGYRNAQASVLAPTGTIGFMMDCDTTGRRAGPGAGEVQEAGRRRHDQDRQQYGAAGADASWGMTIRR